MNGNTQRPQHRTGTCLTPREQNPTQGAPKKAGSPFLNAYCTDPSHTRPSTAPANKPGASCAPQNSLPYLSQHHTIGSSPASLLVGPCPQHPLLACSCTDGCSSSHQATPPLGHSITMRCLPRPPLMKMHHVQRSGLIRQRWRWRSAAWSAARRRCRAAAQRILWRSAAAQRRCAQGARCRPRAGACPRSCCAPGAGCSAPGSASARGSSGQGFSSRCGCHVHACRH